MVRLRYKGAAYWFRLVSVSHMNRGTWERIKDVYAGEIEVPDGMILISGSDGEMQFLGKDGVMIQTHNPADAVAKTVVTPRESSWEKAVEIGGERHQIGLSWGREDCSHPFLSIDGVMIYPERNEEIQTDAIVGTETTLTREGYYL